MSLTEQDVIRIARLARIDLPAINRAIVQAELNDLIYLIERLQSVDTHGVQPMEHPLAAQQEVALRLRDDIVTESEGISPRNALTTNAPAMEKDMFLVPKVIE